MRLQSFFDWLSLRDYEKAKADAQRKVFARFARGNVLVQRGRYINDADAADIIRRGDIAIDRIERKAAGHKHMMARRNTPLRWVVPVLAAALILAALELTYRFNPVAAWALGAVVLALVVARLIVIGRREGE